LLLRPLPPLRHRAAVIEQPQNATPVPFELSITASSSALTPGAPLTSLQAPSAAPLLHHCRPSLTKPSDCGQPTPALLRLSRPHPRHRVTEYILPNSSDPTGDPYSSLPPSLPHRRSPPPQRSLPVSSSPLFGSQTGLSPCQFAPRPLHHRPLAGRISLATRRCRWGRMPPLFCLGPKG
jgi:hypothetical protein